METKLRTVERRRVPFIVCFAPLSGTSEAAAPAVMVVLGNGTANSSLK